MTRTGTGKRTIRSGTWTQIAGSSRSVERATAALAPGVQDTQTSHVGSSRRLTEPSFLFPVLVSHLLLKCLEVQRRYLPFAMTPMAPEVTNLCHMKAPFIPGFVPSLFERASQLAAIIAASCGCEFHQLRQAYFHVTSLESLGNFSQEKEWKLAVLQIPLLSSPHLFPQIVANYNGTSRKIEMVPGKDIHWPGNGVPRDVPVCGFENSELICRQGTRFLGAQLGLLLYWPSARLCTCLNWFTGIVGP